VVVCDEVWTNVCDDAWGEVAEEEEERIYIEVMTTECKLKASREGSK